MNNIFLAAATRSGSTHVKNCFVLLGWQSTSTHVCLEGHYNEEHMVDAKVATVVFPMKGLVFQQHTRAIGRSVEVLKMFNVKPVVLYRNVLDSVVSFYDSTDKGFRNNPTDKGGTFLSLHLPDWPQMTRDERMLWVAYNVIPWWYSFYVSWRQADIESLFVGYEDFHKNQREGLKRIIEFTSGCCPYSDAQLETASMHKGSKFNVGVVGRGDNLPRYIIDIAYEQAKTWGPWREEIERCLLNRGV